MANFFPPVVDVKQASLEIGSFKPFHTLFDVSDLDGNPITKYRFRDNSNVNFGSFFTLQGVRQAANTWIEIDASLLFEVKYHAALIEHSESISVQAYDGTWSNVDAAVMFTIPRNLNRPVVTASPAQVLESEAVRIETLFNVTDGDNNPILRYYFVDRRFNTNGGHFTFDNVRLPSAQWFIVEADEIDRLRYVAGAFGPQTENVGVRAFDGKYWSDVFDFPITTTPNLFRPVVNAFNVDTPTGRVIRADSLFSWSDADGNTAKFYAFYDTGPDPISGYFTVNGVKQAADQWFTVEANDLGSVQYHTSQVASYENFRVRVNDGRYWSVVDAAQIRSVPRPKVEFTDLEMSVDALEKISVSSLLNKVDNGPNYIQYQVLDENDYFKSGELWIGFNKLEQGALHTLTPAEFQQLQFEGAVDDERRTVDELLIRADNGTFWTEWQRVRINTDPVGIDSLIIPNVNWVEEYDDGTKTRLTYTFIDGINATPPYPPLPAYYGPNDPEFQSPFPLDDIQRTMVREVVDWFESVADLDFIEIPYRTIYNPDFVLMFGLFAADGPGGELAHAYLPGGNGLFAHPGDIWFDWNDYPTLKTPLNAVTDVSKGSSMRATTIHETMHAIGYKHPFEPPISLPQAIDFDYNTVMSYTRDFAFHPEEAATGMLYDIWALQETYGANMEYNTGNNHYIYGLDESHMEAIWDAGGIDTINLTNQVQDNVIDLHEGARSSSNGVANSILIAYDVTIENARGGFGNDLIIGNEIRNLLFGNSGDDTLEGNSGNDVLRGGEGNDTYVWRLGDGRDTIREEQKGGIDVIEIHEATQLDLLEDDFVFRRFGRDLRIDLTLNQGEAQGSVVIKDMAWGGSGVETLRLFGAGGSQIGEDIDLRSIFNQADTTAQRFRLTTQETTYGFIAVPV